MSETKELLRRGVGDFEPMPDAFDRVLVRRDRKRRNQRVAAGVLGIAVFAIAAIGFVRLLGSEFTPAGDPRSPFEGTWVSTSDADGGAQTMTVRASADGAVEIVVRDDVASVCSGVPSTTTGTGRLEGSTELVIPSPVYTCDDGSEPEALSGPPLEDQLRDLTFVHDPETETLTDNFGSVWERPGAEDPPTSENPVADLEPVWPQSSPEEVREAQELADAGDPRYTWQVDPQLVTWWKQELEDSLGDAEIFARFLQEELGWDDFKYHPIPEDGFGAGTHSNVAYIRCAPGRTNPLYPAEECAPTIDDVRYEMVSIDVAQLVRQNRSGIWVVTDWEMISPLELVVPPSEAETTELLETFLQARIDGEGAGVYVDLVDEASPTWEVPLLYATTTGAAYERSDFEVVEGPVWPDGWMRFRVRLFSEGGGTVVEQLFLMNRGETGRLGLQYEFNPRDTAPTTENGQAVPMQYRFLDGAVTFRAAWPWHRSPDEPQGPSLITLFTTHDDPDRYDARLALVADPRPIEGGCLEGPTPADAEALARSIRSDPDLETTDPVAATVGGIPALRMDVVTAPGASACDRTATPLVVTGALVDQSSRMRLYLLDLPGGSPRVIAIAITVLKVDFERVMEKETAILDSFEFHTG